MLHLMKYRLISILRQKQIVFWSMLFPILLGTLFYVSFGSSDKEIETINVALVKEDDSIMSQNFASYIKMIEEDDSKIISVKELSRKEADKKLQELDITGIYIACEEPELIVTGNNISSSILNSLLDTFNRQAQMYIDIGSENPGKLKDVIASDYLSFVDETTLGGKSVDGEVQYFLSLIGMACMFGCFIGYQSSVQLQANVSSVAVRRAVSSVGKFKQLAADTLVSVFLHYINLAALLLFLIFILKIDISGNIAKLAGICVTGGFIGVSIGIFTGTLSKLNDGVRIGILVTTGLVLSFLSGLMVGGIKGVVEDYFPLLNRINPAAVITDAIYSASIYDDGDRYAYDIVILIIMSGITGIITFLKTRGERYDSI